MSQQTTKIATGKRQLFIKYMEAMDGRKVRVGLWGFDKEPKGRYAFFINGRSEWIEKYDYFYKDLALADDVTLATLDHCGQGKSEGQKGHINSYLTYAQDLHRIRQEIFNGKQPEFVIAHSMGCLISLYSLIHHFLHTKKLFLLSPLLGLKQINNTPALVKQFVKFASVVGLGKYSTGFTGNGHKPFETNGLTSDPHRFEEIMKSPFRVPPATFGWVKASLEAIGVVFEPSNLSLIEGEVFILLPGNDPVVDHRSTKHFKEELETFSDAKVVLKPFDDAKHELLSETHKIYWEVVQYINRKIITAD